MLAVFISSIVSFYAWRFTSSRTEGSFVSFASEDRWQSPGHVTRFDGNVSTVAVVEWWKLPRVNGWKVMTTGGAARAQVLDSCPLTYRWSVGRCCPRITNWPLSGRGLCGMTQFRNFGYVCKRNIVFNLDEMSCFNQRNAVQWIWIGAYHFACRRKVVHLCFIMSPGKMYLQF